MVSSTLLFESGVMKISDYDPIHGRYKTRTLQLPTFPLLDHFDLPLFEPMTFSPSALRKKRPVPHRTMSRFIECFELLEATDSSCCSSSTSSSSFSTTASTLRSVKSTSSKKAPKAAKAPRRCYSHPNMSNKHTKMKVDAKATNKAPKRSLSNAFQALSGLLPKRRLSPQSDDDNDTVSSRLSICSSTTTLRLAWQGTTWLDEMKTVDDGGARLASFDRPWWTMVA